MHRLEGQIFRFKQCTYLPINLLILKAIDLSYGYRMAFGQWLLHRNVNISPGPAK